MERILPLKHSVVFPSREFQSLFLFALVRSAIETRLQNQEVNPSQSTMTVFSNETNISNGIIKAFKRHNEITYSPLFQI